MATVTELGAHLGIAPTCAALGLPRATYYRRRRPRSVPQPRPASPRALSPTEQAAVLAVLHEPRFGDLAPAEVYATLLDEGQYLCSERTMYRILAAHHEVRERRNQLRHPPYAAPELLARQPNELWSWDITKLLGPAKWTYFYLYVMLDVFSRYVVGWMVAHRESATLAERFIRETCARQAIGREQLTIHADRGSAMTSKSVAFLLADLGVTRTHSRPHVSNDNPFSEAQFKTLKYRPAFPARFGSIQDARAHGHDFFPWSRYAGDPRLLC
jgi:putative transposase